MNAYTKILDILCIQISYGEVSSEVQQAGYSCKTRALDQHPPVEEEIPEWMQVAVDQHRELLTRLKNGDLEGATDLMSDHLDDMRELVLEDFAS